MNCAKIPTFPCPLLQVHVHSLSLLPISKGVCKRTKLIQLIMSYQAASVLPLKKVTSADILKHTKKKTTNNDNKNFQPSLNTGRRPAKRPAYSKLCQI
jgi:hypothetical protein